MIASSWDRSASFSIVLVRISPHQVPAGEGEEQLGLAQLRCAWPEPPPRRAAGLGDHLAGRGVDEVLGEDRVDERARSTSSTSALPSS